MTFRETAIRFYPAMVMVLFNQLYVLLRLYIGTHLLTIAVKSFFLYLFSF